MTLYSRSETDEQSEIVLSTTITDSVDKRTSDNGLLYDGDSTVAGAQGYATVTRRVVYIDDVEATLDENRERGLTAPGWWEYMTYTDASGSTRHKAQHLVAFKDAPQNTGDLDDRVAADNSFIITFETQPTTQYAFAPLGGITGLTYPAADPLRAEGSWPVAAGDYTTSGNGEGAEFTVVVDNTGAVTVSFVTSNTSGGQGFNIGDTITIPDAIVGDGGAAAVVLTVSAVAEATATFSSGASVTGTGSISYQWQTQTPTGTRWTNISGAQLDTLDLTDLTFADDGRKYRVKVTSSNGAPEVISDEVVLLVRSASWYWND